ncbi:MAG: hypothetical protein ACI97A_001053 [Planctomycetota bacterium]|jgi:hypothetical protein
MRKIGKFLLLVLLTLAALLALVWSSLALHFGGFDPNWVGSFFAILWPALIVGGLLFAKSRKWTALFFVIGFGTIVIWWMGVEPSGEGSFQAETSRHAWAEFQGDKVTVHEVRNFNYRSGSEFDPHFETRSLKLSEVTSLDLGISYWDGLKNIAHTFLSFGIGKDEYLCVSVEVRKEKGQDFEVLPGIFKQYELSYVWADERDVIGVRTNYRNEEVFLYRTTCTAEDSRMLLEDMLKSSTALREKSIFYNTLTQNCTSTLVGHVNHVLPKKIPWYNRRFQNGLGDRRAFDQGWLKRYGTFEETKKRAHVNARAQAAGKAKDFSKQIRAAE